MYKEEKPWILHSVSELDHPSTDVNNLIQLVTDTLVNVVLGNELDDGEKWTQVSQGLVVILIFWLYYQAWW